MKTYFVDSFTNQAFKGNPAGVCIVSKDLDDIRMQNIAKEIGFSETAFIKKTGNDSSYSIRYFSPKNEIPLCGHATLASAKVIYGNSNVDQLLFITQEGVHLPIKKEKEKIIMEFPVYETTPYSVPKEMLTALGIEKETAISYCKEMKIIIIEITSSEKLAELKPDFVALLSSYQNINGVLVTAASSNKAYDFQYRYFWPWSGTNEDPVTGGVQTFLTKYWVEKLNKKKLNAFQCSERTGSMIVELKNNKVLIYGEALIVLEGQFK